MCGLSDDASIRRLVRDTSLSYYFSAVGRTEIKLRVALSLVRLPTLRVACNGRRYRHAVFIRYLATDYDLTSVSSTDIEFVSCRTARILRRDGLFAHVVA